MGIGTAFTVGVIKCTVLIVALIFASFR